MTSTVSKPQPSGFRAKLLRARDAVHRAILPICATFVIAVLLADYAGVPLAKKFTVMQYSVNAEGSLYHRGWEDAYMVGFFVAFILMVREALIRHILQPVAAALGCIKSKRERWAEQIYYAGYWTIAFVYGYIHISQKDWWFNNTNLYRGYPHYEMSWDVKFMYMFEGGFWLSCAVGHLLEKPRSDFWEMNVHHVATLLLMGMSYYQHFTRLGTLVLVNQDFADILLPVSKALIYCKLTAIANSVFVIFIIAWFVTRLIYLPAIVYSMYTEMAVYSGGYGPEAWNPAEERYFSFNTHVFYVVFLGILVVLMYMWFYMILRVAYRAITGVYGDNRSDSEEEGEAEPAVEQASVKKTAKKSKKQE